MALTSETDRDARGAASDAPLPRAAYLHVPFCRHRCGYCNFTLLAGRDDLVGAYLDALEIELSGIVGTAGNGGPHEIDTLFLGGGTPTHLPLADLARLMQIVRRHFSLAAGYEWSIEANPLDLTADKLQCLAEAGVTRISIGAQSFNRAKLAVLERDHAPQDVTAAVERARAVAEVSLDLIFGVPGETGRVWGADLDKTLALGVDHVSTYGLTFERGAAFWSRREKGDLAEVGEELERQLYLAGIERLTAAGLEHYEVSNFARPGHRCRHNETYWRGDGYYAAGPGAASYVAGERRMNHRSTTTYIRRVLAGRSPIAEVEMLSRPARARELLVFALRRIEGVERNWFFERSGYKLDELVGPELSRLVALGMLSDDGARVRLTREGLLVSDSIWPSLL